MERLSEAAIKIVNDLHGERLDYESEYCPLIDALIRLASYEDTWLEPEEVEACKNALMGKSLAEIKEIEGIPVERIKVLAKAEAEGRLLVLPCKVGDTVYEPTSRGTISTYLIRGFRIEPFGSIWLEWHIQTGFVYRNIDGVNANEIGKTVFLTREEAEEALKGENHD